MPNKTVNVFVVNATRGRGKPLAEKFLRQIAAVSPRINLREVTDMVIAEQSGDLSHKEELDALLAEAEVIYGFAPPSNVVARAPGLKWIQSKIVGVNYFLTPELISSPVIVTSTKGMHGTSASELVFTMMLTFAKQTHLWSRLKQEKRWQTFVPALLYAKTLGVLGLGTIGGEVARLGKAFGMRVVALKVKQEVRSKYADLILPPEQLKELLAQSDFVVICLPLTPETTKLIGEAELRAMKPTAYLINIARGGIIDEEALIRALNENRIAGAGLDVFATEPLPTDSKLWDLPNVLITSHIAGQREDYDVLATDVFCKNLRRYLRGQKLINVVDKNKGY